MPEIGTGSEVIQALLILTGYLSSSYSPTEKKKLIEAHKITQNWEESTATWNGMSDKYDTKVEALAECERSYLEGSNITPALTSLDLTSLVKKWYKDTPNYGVLLKSVDEVYDDEDFPAFYSKDNTNPGVYNPKPIFQIEYRNQNGIESYLHYKQQFFNIGTTYVNTYNGNMTGIFNIANTIGGQFPVNVQLVYNTNDVILNNQTYYGNGFRLNLEQTIKNVTIDNTEYLEYVDEDGTIHYFKRKTELLEDGTISELLTTYVDEDNLNLTIETTDEQYIMTDKNGNISEFSKINSIYRLTKLKDVNNNIISIIYDNDKIIKVLDNYSSILFSYNENNIVITSSNNISTTLFFENGKIKSINTMDATTEFNYDINELITSIIDVTGTKIEYEYYSEKPFKIKKITQYGLENTIGEFFSLEYGNDSTTIIDNKERVETLIFNSYGNLLSRNSLNSSEDILNAYSITQDYGNEMLNKNRILSSSIPMKYINNYLTNTSFETDSDNFIIEENGITKTFSNEYSFSGNRSMQLNSEEINRSATLTIAVPKGNYYTFSGHFKNSKPIAISLSYTGADGNEVTENRQIASSDDFIRNDITIFYDSLALSDLKIKITLLEIGTIYVDDIQLELGEVANNFNIIENSDFSKGHEDWILEATDQNRNKVSANQFFETISFNNNKNKALKVKMNPLFNTKFRKEFPIKGKKGDLFTISFWYKNEGVKGCRQYAGNTVTINFKPTDGEAEYCVLSSPNFNCNDDRWQFYSYRNRALEDYSTVEIIFEQNTEVNNFYITNLSFYKNVTSGDFNYDEQGNLVSISNQSEIDSQFKYDTSNQLISASNTYGENFKYEYDNNQPNKILSAFSSSGISNEINYDSHGNPISIKVKNKYVEEITNGIYRIRAKGTAEYIKAKYKDIVIETNACSNTVWKIEKMEDKFKFCLAVLPEFSLSYIDNRIILSNTNQNNLFTLESNENGSYSLGMKLEKESKHLKVLNNRLEMDYKSGNDASFEFYIETTDDDFMENSASYTEDGRFIKSVTNSSNQTVYYDYDDMTGLLNSSTNAAGQVTNYTYNIKQQLIGVEQNDKKVIYNYNDKNLLAKIDLNNKEYNLEYGNFLNIKSIKLNNSILLSKKEYADNNGNLIKTIFGNGGTIVYDYDLFDRVIKISKGNDEYCFKYNNAGNVSKIINNNHISKYTYDLSNRMIEYNFDDYKIKYTYNDNNSITKKKYILNNYEENIERTLGKDNIILQQSIGENNIKYSYDKFNRVVGKSINDKYCISYDYIVYGKQATPIIKNIKINNDEYSYNYDKLNNITHVYHNDNLIKQYCYNQYNELIEEIDHSKNLRVEYQYDLYGNLIKKISKINDLVANTKTYTYGNSNWKDQLTSYDNNNIQYDISGNPIAIGSNITLTWKNGNEMASYIDSTNDNNILFQYNENGYRTSKMVNNVITQYYLEGNQIVYEKQGNDLIYYIRGDEGLIGFKYNNKIYYYVKNLQEDIIGILDDNYNQIVTYEYDAWGKVIAMNDSSNDNIGQKNPYRYRSYYYDVETSLYYLNKRYYNPEWGRFLTPDTYIGVDGNFNSYNLYTYAGNNPVNYIDPNGQSLKSILKKATKAIKKAIKKTTKKITKAINKITNAAKNVWNSVKKTASNVYNGIKKGINNLKDSFVFEIGSGVGAGKSVQVGPAKVGTGIYHKFGTGYNSEGSYQYTSESIGATAEFNKKEFGLGFEATSNDPSMNPLAPIWGILEDEDAEIVRTFGYNNDDTSKELDSTENTLFIGIGYEYYCILGFDIKIGFEFDT